MSTGKIIIAAIVMLIIVAVAQNSRDQRSSSHPQRIEFQYVECPAGYTPDPATLTCK